MTLAISGRTAALSSDTYARRARRLRLLACLGFGLIAAAHTAAMLRFGVQPVLIAPLAVGIAAAVVLVRPVAGLYLLLGGGLLFEQWGVQGVTPATSVLPFFENLSGYSDVPVRLSLADLLILLVLASWLLRRAVGTVEPLRAGPLGWAVLAYGAAFLLGLGIGVARGESWNELAALAELRAPVHLCALYFLTVNLVRTPAQASVVLRVVVSVIAIKAMQGLGNFIELRDSGVAFEAVTSHEDVLFFNLVPILAFATVVLDVRKRLTRVLLLLVPLVLVVEALSQRRVGFVALGVGMAIAVLLLFAERRQRTVRVLAIAALVLSAYGVIAWNEPGIIGQPLRALRAFVAPEEISERDRLSNYWRFVENANISFTISQVPFTGVGLGQQYLFQEEPPPLDDFIYWRYMTHNAVYWLWLKAGVLGFVALWLLVGHSILVGGSLFRRLRPELKVLALLPVVLIGMQLIYSSVDLGLTYSRPMMVLGVALGLLAALAAEVDAERRSGAKGRA